MRKQRTRWTVIGVTALTVAAALTACSSEPAEPEGPVELVIGNKPAATETARLALFEDNLAAFQKEHPNYEITAVEDGWDAQTFAARLASGDLPTVVGVPFTEISGLIARGQVADITDAVNKTGVVDILNPQLVDLVSSDDRYYGVPTQAYAMGLVYNRDLFTQAGLDPDAPPTTWDEVRDAAKAIKDKTGVYGFAQVTTDNQGGWVLGAQLLSRGGSIVNEAGDTIEFDDSAAKDSLQLLHDMRWVDDSLSPNGLMTAMDLAQNFGGGQSAMFVLQSDAYQPLTELLGFPAANFGFAAMPTQKAGESPVTLSGGNIDIVSPNANAAQIQAAVEWIQFNALGKFASKDAARANAEALSAGGGAVAIPGIPVVTPEMYTQYLDWIADLNNVPLDNFAPYLDRFVDQTVVGEPPVKGQDIYATLDPVVQAVITDQSADIPSLLTGAATAAQDALDR